MWHGLSHNREKEDIEVKKQYQVKISYRFAALDSLDGSVHSKRAWESILQNIKLKRNRGQIISS
jgi:hypothetical protein